MHIKGGVCLSVVLALDISAPLLALTRHKINGRWYCYQRPLRLRLEVPWPQGPFFPLSDVRFPNLARRSCWFALALWVSHPALLHLHDAALDVRFLCAHRLCYISLVLRLGCLLIWRSDISSVPLYFPVSGPALHRSGLAR